MPSWPGWEYTRTMATPTKLLTPAPSHLTTAGEHWALALSLAPQPSQNHRVLCHSVTFLLRTLHWLPTVCCGWTEAHLCWIMIIIGNL